MTRDQLTTKRLGLAKAITDFRTKWEGKQLPPSAATDLDTLLAKFTETATQLNEFDEAVHPTIDIPGFQACFVNTRNKPLITKHIAWQVKKTESLQYGTQYVLFEVVEETYAHPDFEASEDLTVKVITLVSHNIWSEASTPAIVRMLDLAQESLEISIGALVRG